MQEADKIVRVLYEKIRQKQIKKYHKHLSMSIDYEQKLKYVDMKIMKLMKYYNFKNYQQEDEIREAIRENE